MTSPDEPTQPEQAAPLLKLCLDEAAEATVIQSPRASGGGGGSLSAPGTWEPPSVEALRAALPQYEITEFLARGGMGAVYKGEQRTLRRAVAIKVLPPEMVAGDAQFAARFEQEARAMARLSHPNIVAVFDAGEVILRQGGQEGQSGQVSQGSTLLYFVMEFVEGTDVAHLLASEGRLEAAQAVTIITAVCEALAFAHEEGIVHRDIKPSNIMIDKRGRVKVADFGLAKAVNIESTLVTRSDVAMGTPDFVAPEALIGGMKVDGRADIYAVGVMLYQMLTGAIPRGRFELPSRVVPKVDRRFDAIIDKAMQTDREKRYPTATAMKREVERLGPRSDGFQPSSPTAGCAAAKRTRRSLKAPLLAAAVLALGTGAFFLTRAPEAAGVAEAAVSPASTAATRPPAAAQDEKWVDGLAEWWATSPDAISGQLEKKPGGSQIVRTQRSIFFGKGKDIAVRVTARGVADSYWQIGFRQPAWPDGYRATLSAKEQNSPLAAVTADTVNQLLLLKRPRGFIFTDSHTLELRAQGDLITALLDGEQVAQVRDSTFTGSGRAWFAGPIGTLIEKLEYRDLSAPAPAGTVASSSEPWQDLLKLSGWNAPWKIENGVLTRPTKTMARRQWNDPVQDGAWRVTRRWDGGWYDLQLGLRTRGRSGLRLHFDKASQPDLIRLLIGRDDDTKLGFAETKKRFQKGDTITVEFRAVGEAVTASIDGETVVTVKDEIPEAGKRDIWTNYGDAPAFHKVEFLNLDNSAASGAGKSDAATSSPSSASAATGAPPELWRQADAVTGRITRTAEGWRVEGPHTFKNGPARDGAVRVRAPFSPELQKLRLVGRKSASGQEFYQVFVNSDGGRASIQRRKEDGSYAGLDGITATPLATPIRPGEPCELEARFVGSQVTVKLNGQAILQGGQQVLSEGSFGLYTGEGAPVNVQSIEVLNLDGLAGAEALSRAPGAALEPGAVRLWSTAADLPKLENVSWEDDALKLQNKATVSYDRQPARDQRMRATIRMTPAAKNASLFLRRVDRQRYVRVTVSPETQRAYITLVRDGKFSTLGELELPRRYGPDEWLRLEVEAVDSEIRVRVEGQVLATCTDPDPAAGRVCAYAEAEGYFRDVIYVPLDVADTPATATKDAPFVNTLGMKFVPVPITGGPTDGKRVLFSIWETRVQDYEVFVQETQREWKKPDFEQGPTHPAVIVSWRDAQAFCAWLTERERKAGKLSANEVYRLPSDHEWSGAAGIGEREDAAKLPTEKNDQITDAYPWGKAWPPPLGAGNFASEELTPWLEVKKLNKPGSVLRGYHDGFVTTAPVGSYEAGYFGLHDLAGNVNEWCEDWLDMEKTRRVTRGGSFQNANLRSSRRNDGLEQSSYPTTGFRVVLAPEESPVGS